MPSSSKFKIPSLGSSSGRVKLSGGFVLPTLGNLSTGPSSSPSNLTDLAKSQLSSCAADDSENKKSFFMIPKLFSSESNMNVEKKTEPEKILIDLKSALVPELEQENIVLVSKVKAKEKVEVFIPQFVDCDNIFGGGGKDLIIDDLCERVTLNELKLRYKNLSFKKFSMVGKIIRYKFRKNLKPVQHVERHKHVIQRFAFDTPSPDDKILAHLNKTKK